VVEHDLAKVGVEGSSPFARSKTLQAIATRVFFSTFIIASASSRASKASLVFTYTYAHMFGRPPIEADLQRHFQARPPSVHHMIVTLERSGLIRRQPRRPKQPNPRGFERPAHPELAWNQPS
jgi:hypothetical protein